MNPLRSLLLDRDGTLIRDAHYLADPAGVELLPGVGEALRDLAGQGVRFFVVSNQSGIGRGYFVEHAAHDCNARMAELLGVFGVELAAVRFCPHAPEAGCACRKPGLGMWRELAEEFRLQPAECGMVGDKIEDLAFAAGAGLALRVLTLTGKGGKTLEVLCRPTDPLSRPDRRAAGPLPRLDRNAAGHAPHLIIENFRQLVRGIALWSA